MKRLLLFLTMALTLFGVSQAETQEVTPTSVNETTIGSFTISYAKNNGTTDPVYNGGIRLYYNATKGCSITIKANDPNIILESIAFTCDSGYTFPSTAVNSGEGTMSTSGSISTWKAPTGSEMNEITLYNTQSTNKQVRFTKFVITYSYKNTGKETVSLSFPENSYDAVLSEGFTAPNLDISPSDAKSEVKFYSSDTSVALVNETTGEITLKGAGETTITASITESSKYNDALAQYKLFVSSSKIVAVDEIVTSNFTGISYTTSKDWTSNDSKATYKAQASSNNGFQMRTSKPGCGIYVVSAPNGKKVSNINIEIGTAGGGVSVYASDKQISSASGNAIQTGVTSTSTINIDAPYFLIVPTNDSYTVVSKVIVNWIEDNNIVEPDKTEWTSTFKESYSVEENGTVNLFDTNVPHPSFTYTMSSTNGGDISIENDVITGKSAGLVNVTASWNDDETWKAGNTTFTVTVDANSTTEPGSTSEVTFDFVNKDYGYKKDGTTKLTVGDTMVESPVTIKYTNSGSTNGLIFFSGDLRIYKGAQLSLSCDNGTITSISVNSDKNTDLGIANNVITANQSSGGLKLYSITVKYQLDGGGTETPKQDHGLTVDNAYSIAIGETFTNPVKNPNNLEVTYTSSDTTVAKVADNGDVTPLKAGSTTITASTEGNETYKSGEVSYTLTVIDPNDIFTEITPAFFTEKTNQAYGATTKTDDYGFTYSAVFFGTNNSNYFQFNSNNQTAPGSGIVVSKINKDYKIKSIDIEMANSNSKEFEVYSYGTAYEALSKDKSPVVDFTNAVKKGFSTNQTGIEIDNYAFAVIPGATGAGYIGKITVHYQKVENTDKTPEISFAEENVSVSITEKDTYKGQTLTNNENLNVVYSSSNQEVATIDESTGEVTLVNKGQTTISAKATGNEGYKELTVSYTLTVTPDPNAPIVDVIELKNFDQNGINGNSYAFTTWTSPESGITFAMGSKYSGADIKDKFDFRSGDNSGLVVNANPNGLYLDKIVVEVPSGNSNGRALNIYTNEKGYGFSQASDFNNLKGTPLGTLDCSTEGSSEQIIIETPQYWGLKSADGALSVNKIYFYYTKSPRIDAELSFTPEKLEVTLGDSFELPVLTNEKEVTVKYTSSDEKVATVDPDTGELELLKEGNTIITASVDPIAEYFGSASYELVVLPKLDAEKQEIIWKDRYNKNTLLTHIDEDPVSYDFEKGTHLNNSPQYYDSDQSARFYAGNTFTISVPRNYELVKVMLMNTNTSNKDFAINEATNGNLSKDENEAEWTPTEGESVHETTFTFSDITRVHEMVVYYKKIFDIEDITLTSGLDTWDIMWEQTPEFEGIAMSIPSNSEADLTNIAENNLKFELVPTWTPTESVEGQSEIDGDFSANGEFIYDADQSYLIIDAPCSGLYELVVSIKDQNVPYSINGEDSLVIGTANIYPAFGGIKLSYDSNETDEKNENFGKVREFTQGADENLIYEFELNPETGEIYKNTLTPKVEIETGEGVEIWYQIHGLDNVVASNANKRREAATDLTGLGFTKVGEDGTIDLTEISTKVKTNDTKQVSFVLAKNGANTPVESMGGDSDNQSKVIISITKGDNYVTAVESIFGDTEGEAEFYTLDGLKVNAENLQNGLYIVKKGQKAVKVLIKN